MSRGTVFDIQRFSLHDGPGIRTTVFMKGCPMTCRWCQNPEGRDRRIMLLVFDNLCSRCGTCAGVCPAGAIRIGASGVPAIDDALCVRCGRCVGGCDFNALAFDGQTLDVAELLEEVSRDIPFFRASGGGVTFSGGEPLDQAVFVAEAAAELHSRRVHAAVETALCVEWLEVERVLPLIDLFLIDVKSFDPDEHRRLTGADGSAALENFRRLAAALRGTGRLLTRFTLVPGFSEAAEARKAAEFIASIDPELRLELMNFNPLAAAKYRRLKRDDYEFYDQIAPYSEAEMAAFREAASLSGLTVV